LRLHDDAGQGLAALLDVARGHWLLGGDGAAPRERLRPAADRLRP